MHRRTLPARCGAAASLAHHKACVLRIPRDTAMGFAVFATLEPKGHRTNLRGKGWLKVNCVLVQKNEERGPVWEKAGRIIESQETGLDLAGVAGLPRANCRRQMYRVAMYFRGWGAPSEKHALFRRLIMQLH